MVISCIGLVTLVLVVTGATSAFADHDRGVKDYEWHTWSMSPDDGHLDHLNCDPDNDYCALKIMTDGPIQSMSQAIINNEVDTIEDHFDSLGKKMSIDRVTSADSFITASDLPWNSPGFTEYELHCTTFWWLWCVEKDMHFIRMEVQINHNPAEIKFDTYENPDADQKIHDIRKTLSHELFHAMGIDHNSASSSIVYYVYNFGSHGYAATTPDKDDLEARYP